MTNGNTAPVCPVSRSQTPPVMPGIKVPAIPPATDLPSLIVAVNAINLLLQQLLGPSVVTPQLGNSSAIGAYPDGWSEDSRNTVPVVVDNGNGSVKVSRITKVTSDDRNSDDNFIWSWGWPSR